MVSLHKLNCTCFNLFFTLYVNCQNCIAVDCERHFKKTKFGTKQDNHLSRKSNNLYINTISVRLYRLQLSAIFALLVRICSPLLGRSACSVHIYVRRFQSIALRLGVRRYRLVEWQSNLTNVYPLSMFRGF